MANFDNVVRGAFDMAHAEALKRRHLEITETHFLYGLIKNPQSVCSKHLQEELNGIIGILDSLTQASQQVGMEQLTANSKMQEWMTLASSESIQAGRNEIMEIDFLKNYQKFFPQIKLDISGEDNSDEQSNDIPDFLENLNELASSGKLDPVIGRSKEILKVQEILCRRTKNNPVIVGPPGVGKTAIVEGLAGLIVANQVPEMIQGRTIFSLNMGTLMSNTKYRGEFEEKIVSLINFLKKKGRDAFLFIDEIHLLIGTGRSDGAMDAANLLKPALARGELHCIGATTYEEYKKYIESDSALERRFHRVSVEAPSEEDSIQILMGLKEKFEIHHGIEITDEAIVSAVYFSSQYITDRNLPDKAIDVIDEASASLKLSADSMPPDMQEMDSLIKSKKVLASSNKDNQILIEEIKELETKYRERKKEWDRKTLELKKASVLKKKLDEAKFQFEKLSQEGQFEAASKIKYDDIPNIEREISTLHVSWKLSREDIAEVIQKSTGIPVEKILKNSQENLLELEKYLNERILGQEPSIHNISDTLIASHAGLVNLKKPLGSFLLLGPSGVGKTETAKGISYFLFHDENNMFRIDLSEYSEPHSIARLIGAPPGYVGYEKGGILTEYVRRNPYSVVLFDELEKAHMNFSDILLQILDDGRLTDTQGRVVNFCNTVIFLTSNLKNYESFLKPELIGRLDGILHFNFLGKEIVSKLINKELNELNHNLASRDLVIAIDNTLHERITNMGYDERYGARPLKNSFRNNLIIPLSKLLLSQKQLKGKFLAIFNKGKFALKRMEQSNQPLVKE